MTGRRTTQSRGWRGWAPGALMLCVSLVLVGWLHLTPRAVAFTEPTVGPISVAPEEAVESSPVRAVQQWADVLTREVGRLRARCLTEQGFPQVESALRLRRPALGDVRRQPLQVALEDYGPATPRQARTLGFLGIDLVWDEGATGVVASNSAAFETASLACSRWLTRRTPGLSDTQTRAARFRDETESAFIAQVTRETTPALLARARCTAQSHPGMRARWFVEADTMGDLLDRAGVARGRVTRAASTAPEQDGVARGVVRVLPPPVPRAYAPSPGERRLALDYVACADRTGFPGAVATGVERAVARADLRYGDRAARLTREIRSQLARLARG